MSTTEQENELAVQSLKITKIEEIDAPAEIVWETLLELVGPESELEPGKSMKMVLEAWPGGRWYRDLGNKTGHLWGHVQVIKPPKLLELCGPMFMSYAATNHVQYKLAPQGVGTRLEMTHTAIGTIPKEHSAGVHVGWDHELKLLRERSERKAARGA